MTNRSIEHEPRDPLDFDAVTHGARRADGWTPRRQREFIATLARVGSVKAAAKSVGLQPCGAYKLRNKPDGASFARAWDAAVLCGTLAIRDVMIDHALNGIPDPVFHGGKQVGMRRRFNTRGQQWLIERGDRLIERSAARTALDDPEAARARVMAKLEAIARSIAGSLAATWTDPVRRHARELLHGPVPDHDDAFLYMSVPR